MTEQQVQAIGVGYLVVAAEVINRMGAVGIPVHKIQQLLDKPHNEVFIVFDNMGYHIVPHLSILEERYECHAVPGQFVVTQAGKMWKDGLCRLHDSIRAKHAVRDERNEGIIVN